MLRPCTFKNPTTKSKCMVTPVRINYCILLCIDGSCSQSPMILLALKTHSVIEFLQSFYTQNQYTVLPFKKITTYIPFFF